MEKDEVMDEVKDAAKDLGTGGLVGTAFKSCPRDDDENIEDSTERGDNEDNRRDGDIDLPEVEGECKTEK